MPSFKGLLSLVILIVVVITLVPTIFDAVWDTALTHDGICNASVGEECVNGTAKSLLILVPMIFVGAFVIGSVLLYYRG